jgi:fructokinase
MNWVLFRVNPHPDEYEGFEGVCPFHNNCLEGMVSNKAIAKRLNKDFTKLHELDDGERIWEIIGFYLAQLCINLTLTVSP